MDETPKHSGPDPFDLPERGYRGDPLFLPDLEPDDDDETDCPLFKICEQLADLYCCYRREVKNPYAIRVAIEEEIMTEYGLPPDRAAGLFDLSREMLHLRLTGDYQRGLAEMGWLIAFVTEGWTGTRDN